MSVVAADLDAAVADAAAHLYVWALKDIPQDLRDALGDAKGDIELVLDQHEAEMRRKASEQRNELTALAG